MKNIFLILLIIILTLPLIAQERFTEEEWADNTGPTISLNTNIIADTEDEEEKPKKERGKDPFKRKSLEFGIDAGVGLDNDLLKISEILQKEIKIDLDKIHSDIRDAGLNLNIAVDTTGLFFNKIINDSKIIDETARSAWGFGFFAGAEGKVHLNIPKSIFSFLAEGNSNPPNTKEGLISATGAVYAVSSINISAMFGEKRELDEENQKPQEEKRKLLLGVTPAVFFPLVYIPRSGINYKIHTTDEHISMETDGQISVYSPFITENGGIGELKFGVDISLMGEYELIPLLLDVGGSISRIPLIPAELNDRMLLSMSGFDEPLIINGEMLTSDDGVKFPELEFTQAFDSFATSVMRPLRFDIYANYYPFKNDLLIVRPNIGFSVDINNSQGYFNMGVGAESNLLGNLIMLRLATDYAEAVWEHKFNFAFNLRAFELALAASLRSESFAGSFSSQGLGINVGLSFGW